MISKMSHGRLVLLLLLVGYLMLMAGNSLVSLTHPDEVFYTQTAKEMLARHSWLVPYIFDQPQFEKPIFTYWLLIVAAKVFGFTSFGMRFWPAVFGIFGMVLAYWLSYLLFQNKRSAFISAVVLATSAIHFALSRSVLTDMIFSMWVVLTLVLFYDGVVAPKRRDRDIVLLFSVSGVAVLTKGILGFVFPAAIIVLYLFYKKDGAYFRRKSTWVGVLLFLAIAVPWHVLMYKWYGQGFIDEYFKNVHVRRIYEAEHLKSDTWYFYLVTMIGGMFPWSFFLFPAGFLACKQWMARHADKDKIVFLVSWVGLVVFIMQLAKSKLASYIFPVFVPLSVVVGYYFEDILRREKGRVRPNSMTVVSYAMAFLMLAVSLMGIFFAKKYSAFVPDMAPVYIFMVLAFGIAASIFIFNRQGRYAATIGAISSVTVLILVLAFLGRGYAEPWVSCKDICDVFNNKAVRNSTLLCSKFYVRGIRYYTGQPAAVIDINGKGFFSPHPIPFLNDDWEVLKFLESQPVTYCFLKESNVRDIERITQGKFTVSPIKEIGGKYLLAIKKI